MGFLNYATIHKYRNKYSNYCASKIKFVRFELDIHAECTNVRKWRTLYIYKPKQYTVQIILNHWSTEDNGITDINPIHSISIKYYHQTNIKLCLSQEINHNIVNL